MLPIYNIYTMKKLLILLIFPFIIFAHRGEDLRDELFEGEWDTFLEECELQYHDYLQDCGPINGPKSPLSLAREYRKLFVNGAKALSALYHDLEHLTDMAPQGSRIEEIFDRLDEAKYFSLVWNDQLFYEMQAIELGQTDGSMSLFREKNVRQEYQKLAPIIQSIAVEYTIKSYLQEAGDEGICILECEKYRKMDEALSSLVGNLDEDSDDFDEEIYYTPTYRAYNYLLLGALENQLGILCFFNCELGYLESLANGERAPANEAEELAIPILKKHQMTALHWHEDFKTIKFTSLNFLEHGTY